MNKNDLFDNVDYSVTLKNRKKVWEESISINFPQTDNIKTPLNCNVDEIIIWKGHLLTYKYLMTIDEDQRDEIAKDLLNFFLKYDFSKINIDIKEVNKDWESLKEHITDVLIDDGKKFINNVSASGTRIYKYFFPNYLKIGERKRPSVFAALSNKEILFKIIRNRLGNTLLYNTKGREPRQWPMNISPRMLIQGAKCSGYAALASIFKPIVAKSIYHKWVRDGYNVYDYSAGYGGRLLGLMSLKRNVKYFAVEPNKETFDSLIKMAEYFKFNVDIRNELSENMVFDEKMDFIFSSPPYFDNEIYSNDKEQCYNKYKNYDEWLDKYWNKTVENCVRMMKKESVFAVNIGNNANKFMKKITEDFHKIIEKNGLKLIDTWYLRTFKSHLGNKKESKSIDKFEGIYFYGI